MINGPSGILRSLIHYILVSKMNYFNHCVFVVIAVVQVSGNSDDISIFPSMANCPSSGSCFTLASCLQNTNACLTNNSVVTFSSGDHTTEDLQGFVLIKQRQNLTLKVEHSAQSGQVTALANINCSNGMGFAFFEMKNFTIIGLGFHNCGAPIPRPLYLEARRRQTETYYFFFEGTKAAIFMVNIFNLVIDGLYVNNSNGYGLFIINALGRSSISNSQFSYNNYHALQYHHYNPEYCDAGHINNITKCTGGNLVVLFQNEPQCHYTLPTYTLQITNSIFSYGVNLDYNTQDPPNYIYNAGGLSIFTGQVTYSLYVCVHDIVASNNIAHSGANAVVYIHDIKGVDVVVHVEGSEFINGNADLKFSSNVAFAGGIYVYYGACVCDLDYEEPCRSVRLDDRTFALTNSTFINNHGFRGAAINLVSVVDDENLNSKVEMANFNVTHCRIMNNTGYVGIIRVTETRTSSDSSYQMKFFLSNTVVSHNLLMEVVHVGLLKLLPERSYLSTVGIFGQTSDFTNNTISHNSLVGLHLEDTEVDFYGDNFIIGNNIIGGFGGGIRIYHGGIIRLWRGSTLNIASNSADLGGGIYIDHIFKSYKQPCFFDIGRTLCSQRRVKFWDNKARLAGNSIYGGYIENCTLLNTFNTSGYFAFPVLFSIPWTSSLTEVTSHVRYLCFCRNNLPSCDHKENQVVIFPGQEIIIPAVAVGQLNGTVPSVILSEIVYQANPVASIGGQQDVQQLSTVCGDLHYLIKATENSKIQINLQTSFEREQKPTQSLGNALRLYVNITSCPTGFMQRSEDIEHGCDCINFLRERNVICRISDLTFELTPPLWIGYDNTSQFIFSHDSCPFDYCNTTIRVFMLNDTDKLCQFQRSGILCGSCKQGLSIVFGSSKCRQCSNGYSALVLVFVLAGVVLVLALIYLDLTVADGTLNGLILYVNIVRIHYAIIFPPGHTNIVTVLLAWLNLDLGIELCFYDGFDAHTRTWLQYIFPVYVWIIIVLVITLGWHFTIVARIVGSNSVPVLATLLLMSYTKLQRTILESLSFTRVESHLGQASYVWLYDGNILYSDIKHIFLVLTACVFAIGFIIPFTIIVLCGPLLQMKCSHFMLKAKLTAINDAYQGPYKTKYRWWSGAMLLVRTILILFFTANIFGNQRLNFLFIVTVCVLILGTMWNIGTVHKKWWVNAIESFYIVNLTLLAAWCEYNRQISLNYIVNQSIIAYVLVGSTLSVFIIITFSRAIVRVKNIVISKRKQVAPNAYQLVDVPVEDVVVPPTVTYINFKHSESEMENNEN